VPTGKEAPDPLIRRFVVCHSDEYHQMMDTGIIYPSTWKIVFISICINIEITEYGVMLNEVKHLHLRLQTLHFVPWPSPPARPGAPRARGQAG